MSKSKSVTLENCFSLRARIGWQGLRSDEFIDEGPYLVTGTDFINGRVNWDTCYHVTMERYKQDKGIQLHERDLLITKDGTIGKTAVVHECPEKVTLNSGVFVVRVINNDVVPEYLYYVLMSHDFELYLRNSMTGSTIKHLNQEHFYKFSFTVPSDTKEQAKIAEVLYTVDEAIDKTRELIEKYKNIKAGLMQDLLGRGLEYLDEVALGKISDIARGGSPRPIQEFTTTDVNGVNWIKIGDTSLESKYVTQTKEKIIPAGVPHSRKVKAGDFILSNSMSFGRPYILQIDGCIHDGWLAISNYEKSADIDFLYYILNSYVVQRQFRNLSAGSTVKNLKSETVKTVVIHIPNTIEEQQALVEPLIAADAKIDAEREYLSRLHDIKLGLMQDLLTQRVSVVPLM